MNIPISKTVFEAIDKETILKPLETGWVVQGPFVKEFEDKWSKFTGSKYSIATSNCTTALHLSLAALGIQPNDEVIVPAFTWIATANAVEYLGAKPVFCDILLETNNIDPSKIEELITKKTKAIIPVHLFGLAADMAPIIAIANKYNLFIVEDAACGFAAKYKGVHVGNFGNTGCFSFHPRKALTTGEGGMIICNTDDLEVKIRAMRDHGASVSDLQRHHGAKPYLLPEFPYLGYNYRMTDIQGTIGSTQMDRASSIFESRNKIAKRYDSLLENISYLRKPFVNSDYQHGYQAYVCLFMPDKAGVATVDEVNKKRNLFMEYLQGKGISTRPGTHAVHMLEYYKNRYNIKNTDFENAYVADQCTIALPLFPSLTNEEFDYISAAIRDYSI